MKSFWIFALVLIAGCSSGELGEMEAPTRSKAESGDFVDVVQEISDGDAEPVAPTNRHVIYDADIDLSVEDFSLFQRKLPELVTQHGGYVAKVTMDQFDSSNSKKSSRCGAWQVKVRSRQFESFVESLATVGTVIRHHQTAKDVTAEFVDLEARIVNKQKMEARVLELIGHSNRSLNDVVSLEKELSRIRGEIERMQGRMNVMQNRTEFATLTISASQVDTVTLAAATPLSIRVKQAWGQSTENLQSVVSNLIVFATLALPWFFCFAVVLTPLWFVSCMVRKLLQARNLAGGT